MDQDMPNGDASDVGPIDLKALSFKEREALKQRIIRRAHAERARVISAMLAWLLGRLTDVPHADTAKRSLSTRLAAVGHGT